MFQITAIQLESVKDAFALRGESIADWARLHNFNAALVYSVLNGRIKCKRGEAHRIAVELGLKPALSAVCAETGNTGGNRLDALPAPKSGSQNLEESSM